MTEHDLTLTIKTRFYLSLLHLQTAVLFAKQAHKIEQMCLHNYSKDLLMESWSYASGSVFASTAFFEASINELFEDAGETYSENRLDPKIKQRMTEQWLTLKNKRNITTIDKYEVALKLADKKALARSSLPSQGVDLVIKLRNSMVHYVPEWLNEEQSSLSKTISKKLFVPNIKKKFPPNPLIQDSSPFYPAKCLGSGCSFWALRLILAYCDEFFIDMEIFPPPYEHIRQTIMNTFD